MSRLSFYLASGPSGSCIAGFVFLVMLSVASPSLAQTQNYYVGSGILSGNSSWRPTPEGAAGPFITTGGGIANFTVNGTQAGGNNNVTVAGINATADFTITGSTLGLLNNYNNGIVPISVTSGVTLDFGKLASTNHANAGYVKSGEGTLAFTGSTYGGGFTLQAGTVVARGINAFGGANSNKLTLEGGTLATAETLDFKGKYGGGIFIKGDFTLGAMTGLADAAAGTSFNNNVDLSGDVRAITIGNNGSHVLRGNIINGGLTIRAADSATGVIEFNGTQTYTGGTRIESGTLRFSSTNNHNDEGNITVAGGTLDIASSNDQVGNVTLASGTITNLSGIGVLQGASYEVQSGTLAGNLGGSGGLTKTTAGTVVIDGGTLTYSGDTEIQAGTLSVQRFDVLPTFGKVKVSGGSLSIDGFTNHTGAFTLAGGSVDATTGELLSSSYELQSGAVNARLSGTGIHLTKTTSGTVTVSTANRYSGITTINEGVLSVAILANAGVDSGLGNVPDDLPLRLVFNGGTLEYTGADVSTNRGATLQTGEATLAVANPLATLTWGGKLTGDGKLIKSGEGTLLLTSDNDYTGGTTIAAGTLWLDGSSATPLGSGPLEITGGLLKGTSPLTTSLMVGAGGTLAPGSSIGTLQVTGDVTLAGTLQIEADPTHSTQIDLLDGVALLKILPGSTLDLQLLSSPLADDVYVFANYGAREGEFSQVLNLPQGYQLQYDFGGSSLALVSVPEPASGVLFTALLLPLVRRCRRRR